MVPHAKAATGVCVVVEGSPGGCGNTAGTGSSPENQGRQKVSQRGVRTSFFPLSTSVEWALSEHLLWAGPWDMSQTGSAFLELKFRSLVWGKDKGRVGHALMGGSAEAIEP